MIAGSVVANLNSNCQVDYITLLVLSGECFQCNHFRGFWTIMRMRNIKHTWGMFLNIHLVKLVVFSPHLKAFIRFSV